MTGQIGTIKGDVVCFVSAVFDESLKKLDQNCDLLCIKGYKTSEMLLLNPNNMHDEFIRDCLNKVRFKVVLPDEIKIPKLSDIKEVSVLNFKKQCKSTLRCFLKSYSQYFGIDILTHRFKIDDIDIQKQGLSKQQGRLLAADFDCLYYALYILHEPRFEDWVFGRTDKHPLKKGLSVFDRRLNYRLLSESEVPQKGDIIFYMKKSGKLEHVGIFADSKMVNSKWGSLPQIFSHSIFDCPYSRNYKIFRKKETLVN